MKKSSEARTFTGRPTEPPMIWICLDEAEAAEIIQGQVPLRIMEEVDALLNWSISDPTPGRHNLLYKKDV